MCGSLLTDVSCPVAALACDSASSFADLALQYVAHLPSAAFAIARGADFEPLHRGHATVAMVCSYLRDGPPVIRPPVPKRDIITPLRPLRSSSATNFTSARLDGWGRHQLYVLCMLGPLNSSLDRPWAAAEFHGLSLLHEGHFLLIVPSLVVSRC
jgi:hypothetical protein